MPFELSTLAVVPAGLNLTVRGIQTSYELSSVPAETHALFKLIDSTKSDILKAREKRLVLAKTCELEDLTEWDRSVSDTEAALIDLERLLEPARLDLRHNNGKLRVKTRCLWVLRDSKSLSATSDRLLLAHQRMLSAQLMTRIEVDQERRELGRPPPPYATNKNIIRKAADELGKGNDARQALANSLRIVRDDDTPTRPASPVQTVAESTMSARRRAFDTLFERHEHTRTLSQMNPVRIPESIVELQPTSYSHPNSAPTRRESVPASIRTLRRPVPSTSLPDLIQTSAIRTNNILPRPQIVPVPPTPSRSPSPILPPSPPRSPSPFQEEVGNSHQEIIELEAVPISPNRASPTTPRTAPDDQHRMFAQRINFRERIQPGISSTPSPPQGRYRRNPPYPITNPTTPEPTHATPYAFPINPQTPSPSSNEGKNQGSPNNRPSPTSASTDPGPGMFNRTSGGDPPRTSTATAYSTVSSFTYPTELTQGYRSPSSRASASRPADSSRRPSRSHPPLSYRPPPNEFAAAISRLPSTSTADPRSTISSIASLLGPPNFTGLSALDLQVPTISPPGTSSGDPNLSFNAYGLRSVPHVFAGHRKPVNIRWKPDSETGDDIGGTSGTRKEMVYPFSPATVGTSQALEDEGQIEQRDWVYTPYRPT